MFFAIIKSKQAAIIATSIAMILTFQNCSDVSFSSQDSKLTEDPPITHVDLDPKDAYISYMQPTSDITNKTDLLFVVDTSSSLDTERALIGSSILNFIDKLPTGADLNISVLLAHGISSPFSGKLYKGKDNHSDEPAVLKTTELSHAKIQELLKNKLSIIAGDGATDGGEAGLFSLNWLMEPNQLQAAVSEGFFRSDAALAIVFVADENDVCAVYPTGVTPVVDPDNSEVKAKATLCGSPYNITAENTYKKIRELKGDFPTLITGILYTNPADVPRIGENEVGYGYIDLIALNSSTAITLTDDAAQMTAGLAKIGEMVTNKLKLKNIFSLKNSEIFDCAGQVIQNSIQVMVDGKNAPYDFSGSTCEVVIPPQSAGSAGSRVEIAYKHFVLIL